MAAHYAPFKERLREALDSPNLENALEYALRQFRERRAASFEPGEFEWRRDDLKQRKSDFIRRLPELVQQFKTEAEKVGCVVHQAKDVTDARRIVGHLAQERGVKLVVKGKSMATEEIQLNSYLEEQGITVVETDLGEWIIQLAGEHPSHLIAPAVHKTKEEVAALFSKVLGEEIPADIEVLVKVARRELRRAFIDADMGITGANIAIAETGTLVLVTNEGNGRLVSTLPPIHVAILGVEKIVPTLEDATAVLRMLPRSATGQKLSTYTSFTTGPSRTGDIELSMTTGVHGPGEVHIVLLDNGRWDMRDDPDYWEALRCIRCGACSNVCPPYQAVGGHAFGYIYTGPIGLILTAQHHGLQHAEGPQSLCASCNACETICPVGIPLPKLILGVRQEKVAQDGLPWAKRAALDTFANRPLVERGLGLARLLQGPFKNSQGFLKLPFAPGFRNLPAIPETTLHQRMTQRSPAPADPRLQGNGAEGKRVVYFPGCITNLSTPGIGEATATVLEALGTEVVFPQEQWCCGLTFLNAGDRDGAKPLAKQTIEMLEKTGGDYILSSSTSCLVAMSQDYQDLFRDEPEWRERAEALGKKMIDFITFMDSVARPPQGFPLLRGSSAQVTYHDSCQSHNCLGLKEEGRRLLRELLGIEVAEMLDSAVCCGFGGSFSFDHPEVSERVLRRKLSTIEDTGATTVVADNPGCIMHMGGGVNARGGSARVLHLAEMLAEGFI